MGFAPPGVRVPKLFFDRDGRWFVDGEKIDHPRTVEVLTKNLALADGSRNAESSFVTAVGREHAPVEVEDVAFFVREVDVLPDGLALRLSDGTREIVPCPALRTNPRGELYVVVKAGRAWARFSRNAYHALEAHWREKDGRPTLGLGETWSTSLALPLARDDGGS